MIAISRKAGNFCKFSHLSGHAFWQGSRDSDGRAVLVTVRVPAQEHLSAPLKEINYHHDRGQTASASYPAHVTALPWGPDPLQPTFMA